MGNVTNTPPIRSAMRSILLLLGLFLSVSVLGEEVTGTITFSGGGNKIDASSVKITDSQENEWTITTVGTTSFTNQNNNQYTQVGSGNKPATSITFTTTLSESQTITAFSAKFGGFNGTAGTVTLKVGETTVGTGSLNASTDVTVNASVTNASSSVLTITITDISKGVKVYNLSYTYSGSQQSTDCTEPLTALSITSANTATIGTSLTLTSDGGNGGDITWSVTNGTGSATVSGSTLTPVTKGTVTVKATQDDNTINATTYCGAAPTQTITISKAAPAAIDGGLVDELTHSTFASTGSYTAFTNKQATNTGHSSAVYAGTTARNGSATQYNIQLNSGQTDSKLREIATSTSGGFAKRVYVTWATQTNNTANKKLTVYGSSTAYTGSETTSSGTKIGDIAYVEGDTYEYLDIAADYKYIQIVADGAIYMDEIDITWVPLPTYAVGISSTGCELSVKKGTNDVSNGDTFEAGTELTVTNAASTGYENAELVIKKAEDNSDVTAYVLSGSTLTMPAYAINIVATATKKNYIVTLAATNGKIQVGGEDKTSISVAHGETAQLTAVANDGYDFNGWSKVGEGIALGSESNNPMTITVTGAGTVTASFRSTAKTDPEISWSAASANAVKGQDASLPTFNNPNSLTVTYSSTDGDVAEIDGDGKVTIKGVGSTTIKATFTEDANYAGDEKSYTLNVKGRVTWHVIKGGVDDPTYADYAKDAVPVRPTGIISCDESISLVGWTTSTYAKSNTAPATLYTGEVPAVTDNADYYAVWANVEEGGWNEITSVANLTAGTYAICSDHYFMKAVKVDSKNRLQNGGEPSISEGKLTSAPAADCQWTISKNGEGKYLFQNGDKYAIATSTKNEMILSNATDIAEDAHAQWEIARSSSIFEVTNIGRAGDSDTPANKYLRNNNTSGWACYSSNQGGEGYAPRFFKYSAGSATGYTTNCVPPMTVATPTFTPDGSAAYYTEAQTVTISCATNGATIYYSLDGSEPSVEYTAPISIEETKTLKAKAVLEDVSSEIAEATFTINLPLTTMDAIYAKAGENNGAQKEVVITFNNWVVSGVGTDEMTVYVTDGTKGFIIYGSDHGFAVNDKISGTVTCQLKLFSKAAEVVGLTKAAITNAGGSVTNDGVVTPVSKSIADLGGVNTGAPVIISNVTYNSTNSTLVDEGENAIKPYTTLYNYGSTFVNNKIYSVTGIYLQYNNTKELLPRKSEDIVLESKEQPTLKWYVNNTKETEIGATYTINKDDVFAPYFESNSDGAKTYSSTVGTVASIDPSTGALSIVGVGETVISCAVEADGDYLAGSKSFTLKVRAAGSGDATWVAATWAESEGIESNTNFSGEYETIAIDANVSMTWAKAESSNVPAYNNNDKEARLYNKATLTFNAANSKQITGIVFHFTSGHAGTLVPSDGSYTNSTWEGFTNSITFTNSGSAAYIKSIDIEYAQGETTTLVIEDIARQMTDASPQAIAYTTNKKPSQEIVYSGYDETVISIENGSLTPLKVGSTTVTASIAADAPYSSVVTTFKVTVTSGTEVVENVVVLAQKDGVWYALTNQQGSANNSLAAQVVDYRESINKILDLDAEKQAALIWKRTIDGYSVTFQDANDKYLTGGSSSTNLSVADAKCVWTKSDDNYLQGDRSFLYSTTNGYFRCYTPSTAGVTDMPVVTLSDDIFVTRVDIRSGLSEGKWGTICPKQEVKYPAGAAFYQLTYMELNSDGSPYKFFFDEIAENASLEAGKPYLFIAEGEQIKGVKVGDTKADGDYAYNGFVGYIGEGKHISSDNDVYTKNVINYYGLQNNVFKLIYSTSSTNNILDERAYVEISPTRKPSTTALPMPAYSKRRLVVGAGAPAVTTGMDELNASEAPVKVMIDGQLFILRGEKMYNANGQLVK